MGGGRVGGVGEGEVCGGEGWGGEGGVHGCSDGCGVGCVGV